MTTIAPYGTWRSPITAHDLAASGHPVSGAQWVGDDVWWLESRPGEGGRLAVRTSGADGEPVDILPAPWNARTRVHEYGGGAWAVTDAGLLVFSEFTDQRVYCLDAGASTPIPLTPESGGFRFAELAVRGSEVIAVRETHDVGASGDPVVSRDIVAIPLDGSAAADAARIRSIVAGSDFLAYPRFSPDGSRLAWIAWDHPQMPWDGTQLRVGELDADGRVVALGITGETAGPEGTAPAPSVAAAFGWRVLAGSTTESVLQPEWVDDESLIAISDRSGWWNLETVGLDGSRNPAFLEEAEYGGALWMLGSRWFDQLDDGRLLAVRSSGDDTLVVVNAEKHDAARIRTPLTTITLGARRRGRVLVIGGSSSLASGVRILDLSSGDLTDVRLGVEALPDADYLPVARARTFRARTGSAASASLASEATSSPQQFRPVLDEPEERRDVHAFVYAPRNPDFSSPEGELPPYVAFVHGGPTSKVSATLNPTIAFFTSRGIGVVDINYGGSTGYGRVYRERLRGQWGVVDVEDVVSAVLGLADAGLADRDRLAIRGGSAGGWTVLSALTSSTVFAAGTSYYGVAELEKFAEDTHDFESRYLDGLIGPLPEALDLYRSRAPLNNVSRLATPVLLLQGLDDPIVPPSQAQMFRDALAHTSIPHAYIAYEGESHGFRRAETIIHAAESELSFYGQTMGFHPVDIAKLDLS
ncbi:S9 family peptidase [Marisediminicola sp. LYQ85]|uniref:S9 family peptidase n=1 Tax=Marisediminicola sp. LYQ85 TaxID=3391062 RepID=UPI003982D86A